MTKSSEGEPLREKHRDTMDQTPSTGIRLPPSNLQADTQEELGLNGVLCTAPSLLSWV